MFSLATLKALQIYGIAIAISMLVAVLIKVMVLVTGRLNKPAAPANARPQSPTATDRTQSHRHAAVPDEVIAAISAALAVMTGPHRILHIAPSQVSWSLQGRSAQHSHQPQRK